MNSAEKRVFEFTYGEYPADDHLTGVCMVMASFIPHIIAVYTISVTIYGRCVHHLVFLFGLILSHELAKLVKRTVKQPRPDGSFLTSYGMPSDHSMFIVFISTYVILLVFANDGMKRRSQALTTLLMSGVSIAVCFSRLYLGVHTMQQVVVGVLMGFIWGILWFKFSALYLIPSKKLRSIFYSVHSYAHDLFLGTHDQKKLS